MPIFPEVTGASDFQIWRSNMRHWSPLVQLLARSEGISTSAMAPFKTGTNLVVDLDGKSIMKIFPPLYREQFVSERATLHRLAGRLSVATPIIQSEGECDGWSWLVITKLNGLTGSEVWHSLSDGDVERLLADIGRIIAEVQATPLGDLALLEPAWPSFISRQIGGCVARHTRQGLEARFLSDLRQLLDAVHTTIPMDGPHVILTGEWIPENFMLAEQEGQWRITGVIDFGDVITGWGEYDLLGPSAFMCGGSDRRVASLLGGYGISPSSCDAAMRRRLLTLTLLHRASDIRKVQIPGWESRAASLFDLENIMWPVGPRD